MTHPALGLQRLPSFGALALLLTTAAACEVKGDGTPEDLQADEDTGADPDVVAETGDFVPQTTTDPDDGDESDEDGSGTEEDTGCNFICDPPPDVHECDPWSQDCPDGEKCMPWANDGGAAWNSLRCTPVSDALKQDGDACQVEGSGVSGIDDCDIGLMCWDVDENGEGTCVSMCTGSAEAPLCDDPADTCVIANDGVLNLCLLTCDPLLQDCGEGSACYGAGDSFACAPDASGPDAGTYGTPCEYTNACDPGLFCAAAEAVPDCADSVGCCSEFCDLDAANPDEICGGSAGGQQCEPWFVEGAAPPGFESLGACVIPQ
jgi:hypothetical protein